MKNGLRNGEGKEDHEKRILGDKRHTVYRAAKIR